MQTKKLSRRKAMSGVAGIGAATILRWPVRAAEYSWKYCGPPGVVLTDNISLTSATTSDTFAVDSQ